MRIWIWEKACHLSYNSIYIRSFKLRVDSSKSSMFHIYIYIHLPSSELWSVKGNHPETHVIWSQLAAVQGGRASVTSSICSLVSQIDSRSTPLLLPFTIAIDLISSIGQYHRRRGQVCSLCSHTYSGTWMLLWVWSNTLSRCKNPSPWS